MGWIGCFLAEIGVAGIVKNVVFQCSVFLVRDVLHNIV